MIGTSCSSILADASTAISLGSTLQIKSTLFWEESEVDGVLASDGFIIWIFPLGESKLSQTSVKEAFGNIVLFWLPAFDGLMISKCSMFTV